MDSLLINSQILIILIRCHSYLTLKRRINKIIKEKITPKVKFHYLIRDKGTSMHLIIKIKLINPQEMLLFSHNKITKKTSWITTIIISNKNHNHIHKMSFPNYKKAWVSGNVHIHSQFQTTHQFIIKATLTILNPKTTRNNNKINNKVYTKKWETVSYKWTCHLVNVPHRNLSIPNCLYSPHNHKTRNYPNTSNTGRT